MQSAWREAFSRLTSESRQRALAATELEELGSAAFLIGRDEDSAESLTRAHHAYLEAGDAEPAARCAFWVGFRLLMKGEQARGSGWLARARRVLDDAGLAESVIHGYLLVPPAIRRLMSNDAEPALEAFEQAVAIGTRARDRELIVVARHGQGRALIRTGRIAEGITLLDEVMVSVVGGEVSPLVVGDVYCSVIDACNEVFDLRRASEWTAALREWCTTQPDVVPGRGECRIKHAEIAQLHGDWPAALSEVTLACESLVQRGEGAAGAAYYRLAELQRLRGEFSEAEESYARAHQLGRDPQPGLALLRLAQRRIDAAAAAIRGAVDQVQREPRRSHLLAAYVEIVLASGDVQAARAMVDELSRTTALIGAPLLRAIATHAVGIVLLAEGNPSASLAALRDSCALWRDLEAPYESARVRVAMASALRALGDADGASMESRTARDLFRQLGALPDLRRVDALAAEPRPARTELTRREIEVLRLIATGRTNRAIASALGISEKTVARHVSNLFTKLGVSTRAAATAYAFRNDLVATST